MNDEYKYDLSIRLFGYDLGASLGSSKIESSSPAAGGVSRRPRGLATFGESHGRSV